MLSVNAFKQKHTFVLEGTLQGCFYFKIFNFELNSQL